MAGQRGGKRPGAGRPRKDAPPPGTPKPLGRKPSYRAEFAAQAAKLCALGATDFEMAGFFEVDTATIYRWKYAYPDFCEAVKAGKEQADERVARALFNRAVGYSFEGEKVFQFQGTIIRAQTVEHVPPDPGAAMNWLKNRRPGEWRERQQVEHTGKDGGPITTAATFDLSKMTDAELDAYRTLAAASGRNQQGD